MSDPINPQKIYETFESHKLLLSFDLDDKMTEDAKGIYNQARSEIETALSKTEAGSKVYNILNQALNDMPKQPKTGDEMLDHFNKALEDLGPLC